MVADFGIIRFHVAVGDGGAGLEIGQANHHTYSVGCSFVITDSHLAAVRAVAGVKSAKREGAQRLGYTTRFITDSRRVGREVADVLLRLETE